MLIKAQLHFHFKLEFGHNGRKRIGTENLVILQNKKWSAVAQNDARVWKTKLAGPQGLLLNRSALLTISELHGIWRTQ